MKTKLTALVLLTVASTSVWAQNQSTMQKPIEDGYSSRGVRVTLVRPTFDAKAEISGDGFSGTSTSPIDDTIGLSVGYARLPVKALGWTANGGLLEAKQKGTSVQMARIDGNLAYAFTRNINLKGGLNISKFINGPSNSGVLKLDPGVGAQASVGLQVSRTVGVDVGYTVLRQGGNTVRQDSSEFKANYQLSGLEIGLSGTF